MNIDRKHQAVSYDEIGTIVLAAHWDDSEKKSIEGLTLADQGIETGFYVLQTKTWQGSSIPWQGYLYSNLIEEEQMKFKKSEAIYVFRDLVKSIKGVLKIAYSSAGRIVTIWTFLRDFNRESLYEVYEIEKKLIEKYPSISFDFTALVSTAEPIPSDFIIEELHNG